MGVMEITSGAMHHSPALHTLLVTAQEWPVMNGILASGRVIGSCVVLADVLCMLYRVGMHMYVVLLVGILGLVSL